MDILPIKTEADYNRALNRLEVIFAAETGTPDSDEADVLGLLIDDYEKKHYPIEAPDPIEAIKIRIKRCSLNRQIWSMKLAERAGFQKYWTERENWRLEWSGDWQQD